MPTPDAPDWWREIITTALNAPPMPDELIISGTWARMLEIAEPGECFEGSEDGQKFILLRVDDGVRVGGDTT